jgi:hypothetical protein
MGGGNGMTLVRTGLGFLTPVRTGLGYTRGRRTFLGDDVAATAAAIALKYDLTPLAANAIAVVVTNTNISTYARNTDGTLGAPVTGSWTSSTGSATDAGLTPTDDGSNFVGIGNAPAQGKRCWMYFNSDTQDVEWILPGHPLNPQTKTRQPLDRPFGLCPQGGRNHRMLYAHIGFSRNWAADYSGALGQNTPAGSGYFGQWNRALYLREYAGVFDIVGAQIQPGYFYEGLNVTNFKPSPRLRIQRSRMDGTIWYNDGKGGHDGGDNIIQTWHGPTGYVQLDHVTGVSDFQGVFLVWNDVGTNQVPAGQDLSYVNIRTVHPSGAWLYNNTKGSTDPVPPTTLDHVVVQDMANPTRSMDGSTGSLVKTGGAAPIVSADGATATWTGVAGANTTGSIVRVPAGAILPGGVDIDYAPANKTGFDYDPTWAGWAAA